MSVVNNEFSQIIEIENLNLEQHVMEAFRIATTLELEKEIISAAELIIAAQIVQHNGTKSKAFSYISSLISTDKISFEHISMNTKSTKIQSPTEIKLSSGLAESYSIANMFFFTPNSKIWGRDYITLALLAVNDPSLEELAYEAGTTIENLRDAWFEFVTSTQVHRNKEEWIRWWNEAGIPIPNQKITVPDSTYLFTWNPKMYPVENLENHVNDLDSSSKGSTLMKWSTGNRRNVSLGDRVFLFRQGAEPRGIVGYGFIEGEIEEVDHWHEESRDKGKKSQVVPVLWTKLSTEPILSRSYLIDETGEKDLWNTQSGGIEIKPDLATKIVDMLSEVKRGAKSIAEYSFAQTLSDLDHKNDFIGIGPDIEALSTLVSVNRVEPPLSVAILGDWGSGKTFLMHKVKERVEKLEQIGQVQESNNSQNSNEKTRYCSSILQIDFNAWHYTESNLWASLVNQIFENLHEKLSPSKDDKNNVDNVEKFFSTFKTAHAAREVTEKEIELIEAEIKQASNVVKSEERKVQAANKAFSDASSQSIWQKLDQVLNSVDTESEKIRGALAHFGFKDSLNSAQAIHDTLYGFRSVSGRAGEIFGSLLTTKRGNIGAMVVAFLVLVATIAATIYDAPILSVGTAFVGILGWVAESANSAKKHLDAIQIFDEWFTKCKLKEEIHIATTLADARVELERHKEALSIANKQLAEVKAREARAIADLKKLTARDKMRRFVDNRVTTETYAKHLGIISLIRQDFEFISDFMLEDQTTEESGLVKRVSETIGQEIPHVERIILYIDDLDRCQPERVVEVLEAIHLLLAFKLFIVVVAVDPRWVIGSLSKRYQNLLLNESFQMVNLKPEQVSTQSSKNYLDATAHDYIEKIFHIPFWVKPMSPTARKSLIAGYLDFSDKNKNSSIDLNNTEKVDEEDNINSVEEKNRQSDNSRIKPNLDLIEADLLHSDASNEELIQNETLKTVEQKLSKVEISEQEQDFIEKLANHLGNSPRRIKRYANTYRLLKSGLSEKEVEQLFTSSDNTIDSYRIVLVFLAIVTGAPFFAPQIFTKAFEMSEDFDIPKLIIETELEKNLPHSFQAKNAMGALNLLKDLNITNTEIEKWLPRVMRHSFRLTPVNNI